MSTSVIEQEHEALLQFLYMAPIGLLQLRPDGEILLINPLSAQLLMPLSRDGALANLFTALADVAPDLRHRVADFQGSHGMVVEAQQLQVAPAGSGHAEPQLLSLSLLKLDDERLMAVLNDVTQSVRRERELRQSQAWINTIVSGITDYALLPLDEQGAVQAWNPSVGRVTGFAAEASLGRGYAVFYPPDDLPPARMQDRLHEADRSGWSLDEGWRLRADGSRFWGSCLIAPLHEGADEAGAPRGYSLIIRDISDRREAHEALRRSIFCDHLTGLANRRAFFEAAEIELQRWARQPRPLSLVMIDADHFKQINDRHGHAAGDAVLRHLAVALGACSRSLDVVARVGGEEFILLLPDTTIDGAEALASRLCQSIAERPVEIDGHCVRYTVSAGVAQMQAGVAGLDALIKRADAALYQAKALGRNRAQRWHGSAAPSELETGL
ncbi:diguanylate cyclase [Paucibacter sp. O1-1]|nr:diguanylate cyclase [Paucibacter sp. O1-1]MDA3827485.1 diguanylate cyclase [Paucibacter sp. O1-1]